MSIKYFCVSDIHSYYEPLMTALKEKQFDIEDENHILIVCGDAFDRGDDTVKVFEFLKELQSKNRLIYVKGNHEDLLFDCMHDLLRGKTPTSHHFHNKTVKTICQLCGENEWVVYNPPTDTQKMIQNKMQPVLNFIKQHTVDYFQLGNKVFVHSWIPCKSKGFDTWNPTYTEYYDWWDKKVEDLNEKESQLYYDAWYNARWGNPFLMWKNKLYPENKCIVFGHWHCSYGHSYMDMKTKEWPQLNQKNWQDAFKPWIKENAIGLDACCAYSGIINCVVFDENGDIIEC